MYFSRSCRLWRRFCVCHFQCPRLIDMWTFYIFIGSYLYTFTPSRWMSIDSNGSGFISTTRLYTGRIWLNVVRFAANLMHTHRQCIVVTQFNWKCWTRKYWTRKCWTRNRLHLHRFPAHVYQSQRTRNQSPFFRAKIWSYEKCAHFGRPNEALIKSEENVRWLENEMLKRQFFTAAGQFEHIETRNSIVYLTYSVSTSTFLAKQLQIRRLTDSSIHL